MKKLFYLLSVLTLALKSLATTWYVDSSAVGTHNGTSWANAWTSLSQISGLSAGDTVYLSGGASGGSQTYSVSNWKPAAGNSSAPMTYQIGQDAAHNGTVVFSGSGLWLTAPSYAVISGNAGDGQQHFVLTGYSQGVNINGTTGLRLAYINLGSSSGSLGDGIDGQGVSSFELDHCYAYLTSPSTDHFLSVGFNGTGYHQNLIHDNTVYIPHATGAQGDGADGFQMGGVGYSLYNNLVVGYNMAYTGAQHQDGWQSTGPDSYLEFYNNTLVYIGNFALFADAYWGGFNHVRVYNNWCINDPTDPQPGGIVFGTDGGYTGTSPCQYNDIIIANNVGDGFGAHGTVVLENPTGTNHPTVFVGDIVANNIGINGGHLSFNNNNTTLAIDNPFLTVAQGATNFVSYSSSGTTNNNFHLLANATTLIGKGTNLSAFFTMDMDNNLRALTGNWDIGPYAFTPNVPVIQVNPGTVVYGTVPAGTSATNSIVVQNIGTGTLSGSATVGAPFNVVSGGSYSLGAGQTQAVVVVFNPVAASNYNQSVSFSGGGGTNVTVSGNVTNPSTPPLPTIVTEKVTANTANPVTLQFCTNLSSATWWTAGTFSGSTNLSFTNMPAVFIRGICSNLSSSVTLTWPANTIATTMGYKVYSGTASGTYSSVLNTGKTTTATFSNLTPGQRYYFKVDTYNIVGVASPYLSETSATAPVVSFTLSIGH